MPERVLSQVPVPTNDRGWKTLVLLKIVQSAIPLSSSLRRPSAGGGPLGYTTLLTSAAGRWFQVLRLEGSRLGLRHRPQCGSRRWTLLTGAHQGSLPHALLHFLLLGTGQCATSSACWLGCTPTGCWRDLDGGVCTTHMGWVRPRSASRNTDGKALYHTYPPSSHLSQPSPANQLKGGHHHASPMVDVLGFRSLTWKRGQE